MAKNKKQFIYIDQDDFRFFQKMVKSKHYFRNNIHLFTCATLVGRFIVNEPGKIPRGHRKDVIRVSDNLEDENMIIIKCLAISEFDDVDVLIDEDKMFSYCEKYAVSGLKRIHEWYSDAKYDFETELAKALMQCWSKINFNELKNDVDFE